jgi:DNA-binding NarL/FixJ family response regulator
MIRVVLADDQVLVRAGFQALLDAQDDIEVVGEAGDGDEAYAVTRRERPDVVLMDIRMPGTDGLAATQAIGADPALTAVRVVILTTFEVDEHVFEALRGGASGFPVRGTEPAELLRAGRAVAAGDALLSPSAWCGRGREREPVGQTPRFGPRGRVVRFFGGGGVIGLPSSSLRARLGDTRGGSPGIFG